MKPASKTSPGPGCVPGLDVEAQGREGRERVRRVDGERHRTRVLHYDEPAIAARAVAARSASSAPVHARASARVGHEHVDAGQPAG